MSMPWYATAIRRDPDAEWEIWWLEDEQDFDVGNDLELDPTGLGGSGEKFVILESVWTPGPQRFADSGIESEDGWPALWLTVAYLRPAARPCDVLWSTEPYKRCVGCEGLVGWWGMPCFGPRAYYFRGGYVWCGPCYRRNYAAER